MDEVVEYNAKLILIAEFIKQHSKELSKDDLDQINYLRFEINKYNIDNRTKKIHEIYQNRDECRCILF